MNNDEILLSAIGCGEDNATASEDLRSVTGLSERLLRKAIENLRRHGCVIISCDKGYYTPENTGELEKYVH